MSRLIEASPPTSVVREIITVAPLADADPDANAVLKRVKVDYTCGFLPGHGIHKVISEGRIAPASKQKIQAARDLAMAKCHRILWEHTPNITDQENSTILFTPSGLHVEARDDDATDDVGLVSLVTSFTNARGGLVANFRAFSRDDDASPPSFVLSPEVPHNERRAAEIVPELAGVEEKDTTVIHHYERLIRDVIQTQRRLMGHALADLLRTDTTELTALLEYSAFAITHNYVKFWFYVNIENVLSGMQPARPS